MEGLVQLLIVVVFAVVSILDGVARKKRQEEQKERMRRTESADDGVLVGDVLEDEDADWADLTYEGDQPMGTSSNPQRPAAESEERETADQLVPADLWAILTGQKPLPLPELPQPEPPRSEEATSAAAPVPVPPVSSEPESRRSARWMEGLGREPAEARAAPRPVPDGLDAAAVWGAYEDISSGEIGSAEEAGLRYDESSVDSADGEGPVTRRTKGSRYAALVTSGRAEDLRSAIVLREVLGPPVGQRGRDWD